MMNPLKETKADTQTGGPARLGPRTAANSGFPYFRPRSKAYIQYCKMLRHLKSNVFKGRKIPEEPENTYSMVITAMAYNSGIRVEKNVEKAFEFFEKAAKAGNSFAQLVIGNAYRHGYHKKQDYEEATKWLFQAYLTSLNKNN